MERQMPARTELEQDRRTVRADVHRARRQIAMDDALRVQYLQRREQMLNYASRFRGCHTDAGGAQIVGERLRLVAIHHEIDGRVRVDDGADPHQIRMHALGEGRALESVAMERTEEVAIALRRVRAHRYPVGRPRDETAREKFLDDDGLARR